jgi:hypothetical protein
MAHGRRPLSSLVAMGSRRRCNALRLSQGLRSGGPADAKAGRLHQSFGLRCGAMKGPRQSTGRKESRTNMPKNGRDARQWLTFAALYQPPS